MKAGRNDIYEAVIRRMVSESLEQQNQAFDEQHRRDSDEELLDYLRQCAHRLGHSPHPRELLGWRTLVERFGSWPDALEKAGLSPPRHANKPSTFLLIQQEEKAQRRAYRAKKDEKKRQRQTKAGAMEG